MHLDICLFQDKKQQKTLDPGKTRFIRHFLNWKEVQAKKYNENINK